MKPEIDAELMEWLKDVAQKSSDFVEREAPLLATEIVAWHFWGSVLLGSISLAAFLSMVGVGVYWVRKYSDDAPQWITGVLLLIFCFLPGLVFIACGTEAIRACVAPRVIVLEAVGRLTR